MLFLGFVRRLSHHFGQEEVKRAAAIKAQLATRRGSARGADALTR
jgi:hypothetical protein